jgi:2-desacetyl-2-hydroxyethyl bacteriochlorophyllide A dehydrogenase
MKRLVATALETVTLTDVEMPEIKSGEVLIETLVTGVCGSDIHAVLEHHPFVSIPYRPGHEVVGVVCGFDSTVAGFAEGDRVTVEPDLPCWNCKNCKNGNENLCEILRFFGCGYDQGGMADFFTIPANRLHKIPADFSDEQASLVEPLATPVHAVRLAFDGAQDLSEKSVVIIGAGTIGLLTLAAAKHFNAKRIVITDRLEGKRERALRLGADAVANADDLDVVDQVRSILGESADVVFDCVSIQPTVNQAIAMADKAGTVVIVGVPAKEVTIPLPIIQDHQIRIQGSATYLPVDYEDSIKIIASGAVNADEIVTSVYPKEKAQEAFDIAIAGDQVKVLIRFGNS